MATAIQSYIIEAAERDGVDPRLALAIAKQESNFNPVAKAKTSSAFGVYQFIDDTWQAYGIDPKSSKRLDPKTQIDLGIRLIKDNADNLSLALGRTPAPSEIYMAHVLGPGRAKQVLTTAGSVFDALPAKVLEANQWMADLGTTQGVAAWFDRKVAKNIQAVESIAGSLANYTDPQTLIDEVALATKGKEWPLARVKPSQIEGNGVVAGRVGQALDVMQRDSDADISVAVLDPRRSVEIDTAKLSPESRARLLQNAERKGFNAIQFDRNRPDTVSLDMRPGEARSVRFLDAKGKNFIRGKGKNFPADHWAAGYIAGNSMPTDPALAGANTPAEAAGRLPQAGTAVPDSKAAPVQIADSHPDQPFTEADLRQIDKLAARDAPDGGQIIRDAVSAEWVLNWAIKNATPFAPDQAFSLTPEYLKETVGNLPPEYWDGMANAVSAEHAQHLAEVARNAYKVDQELAKAGTPGVVARFAAAMFDPVAIGVTLASEGTVAPLVLGSKVARLGRLAHATAAGTLAAGENAAVEAFLASQKPGSDWSNVLLAGAGGFALGTALNVRSGDVAAAEKEQLARALTGAARQRQASRDYVASFVPDQSSSAGAAQAHRPVPVSPTADAALQDAIDNPAARTAFGGVRFDAVGQTLNSAHPLAAKMMDGLGEDAVGRVGHATNTLSASEYQRWLHGGMETRFHKAVEPAYRDYLTERGINPWTSPVQQYRARQSFMEEVADALRGSQINPRTGDALSDQALDAARQIDTLHTELWDLARRNGAEGFDRPAPIEHFAKRVWNGAALNRARERFGDRNMGEFIGAAIRAARPDVDYADTQRLGRLFWKRLRARQLDDSYGLSRALSVDDRSKLTEQLVAASDGEFTLGEINGMLDKLYVQKREAAAAEAQKRELMDENFIGAVANQATGTHEDFALSSLFENNAENLFKAYSRSMSGTVAMARAGYPSIADFNRRVGYVRKSADEIIDYSTGQLTRDVENLEYVATMITGAPVGEYGRTIFKGRQGLPADIMRLGMGIQHLSLMGKLGFAQLAETGSILGHVGIRTAFAAMPTLRSFRRSLIDGELNDDLARELEVALGGLGADNLRNPGQFRYDDAGTYVNPNEGRFFQAASTGIDRGKKLLGHLSLMNAVNTGLNRWASRAVAQKFADMAHGTRGWNARRLAAYGLDEADANAIFAQIRQHSTTEPGLFTGRALTRLNLDQWDQGVRETFEQTMFRTVRHVIQENDPGNLHRYFSKPFVQMMFQFRSFMLVAGIKQLAHGIHMRDANTALTFLASSFTAGVAYSLQTYVDSVGRRDAEQYRRENLSLERIGAASFARAGWASLMPAMADSAILWSGNDPLFDVRSSGLQQGGFMQNPTVDWAETFMRATSGLAQAPLSSEYDFSEKDFKALTRTFVPFRNTIVIGNALNLIGQGLPEKSND